MQFDNENKHQTFALPGSRPHYTPDRPGQVEHIFLNLSLDIPQQSFSGTCTITLKPIRNHITNLTLDAVNLDIENVKVDQIEQKFQYDGQQLEILLSQPTKIGERIQIAIAYHVEKPQRGLYFITANPHYPNKPTQVWTQGEDEDSRFWFPCFDYPGQLATSEIKVRVPQPLIAISNGELIHSENVDNDIIYHWYQKQVHPTYLMTLAVGDFAEIKDEWHSKPVNYYVEKGREEDAQRSMGKTPQMIEFFSQTFGYEYPFPKYAQVCVDDFIFGGMENTSTTLLTDRCLVDEKALIDRGWTESLVAHELAHQWFGDLVVIKHWSHAWIKEGMATYSEVLWTDKEYGKDDAAYYLLGEARSYLSEDSGRYRRPIVTHIYREPIELYDRHLYEKGACVYHLIRRELGDDLFTQAIHTFVNDNAHKTVETIDLLRAIDKATGRNLSSLFDQYVFRGGHPDYKVNYSWDNDNNLAKVTITQTQGKDELFDLKIELGFGYETQEMKTFKVRVNAEEQSFYFSLETKPDYISFDVGNGILKTVELEYPLPELKAQIKHDPDPVSRIYAAESLAKKGNLEALKALAEALENDPFWGVRLEVAKQIGEIKLDQTFDILLLGLKDQETRVRRTVVETLGTIKTRASYEQIKTILQTETQSYNVEATAARVLGSMYVIDPNNQELTQEIIETLQKVLAEKQGWNEVVRSGAIAGLAQLKAAENVPKILFEYTKIGQPQPLRLAAIRALGAVCSGQSKNNQEWILQQLKELAKDTFFLTQVALVSALEQTQNIKAIPLLTALKQSADGRVTRIAEEAIAKVQKNAGNEPAIKQIREELDQVKKENQELKSRLENLEAKTAK
jgi:aminopeptidase N